MEISNLSQDVSYPGRGTSRLYSVLPGKCQNTSLKISHLRVGQTEVLIPLATSDLVLSPKRPGGSGAQPDSLQWKPGFFPEGEGGR